MEDKFFNYNKVKKKYLKFLTSQEPFSPRLRAKGLKPPQGHLGFQGFNIQGLQGLMDLIGLACSKILLKQFQNFMDKA